MARGRRFRRGPASRRGLVGGYNRSSPLLRWSVSSLRWAARSLRWSSQSLRWSSQSLRWSSRSLPLVIAVAALVIAVADGGHRGCCAGQRGRGAGQRGRCAGQRGRRAGQRGRCAARLFEGDRTPANRVGDDTGSRAVFTGPPRHALTRGAASTRIGLLRLRAPSTGKPFAQVLQTLVPISSNMTSGVGGDRGHGGRGVFSGTSVTLAIRESRHGRHASQHDRED